MNESSRSPAPVPAVAAWIWLGVYALIAAGVLAVLLGLSRTPVLHGFIPGTQWFRVALVAHVDLSVLVWFVAGGGTLWTLYLGQRHRLATIVALLLAVAGAVLISTAPFVGAEQALMANYVPVLQHPWFYAGLLGIGAALAVQASSYLLAFVRGPRNDDATIHFALALAAASALLALLGVAVSWLRMPADARDVRYFELLFWGGGHVLQFMHTILMLVVAWLLLRATGSGLRGSETMQRSLFALTALPLLGVPLLLALAPASPAYVIGYSELMRWGGIGCIPLLLLVVASMPRTSTADITTRTLRSVLWWSLLLFAAGGILGFLIRGSNTVIPAHYHGSIVGVTLAYMGVFYLLLPRLGYPLALPRTARWQPLVYGVGQVMHIAGLAWTGGHGAQRKTVGTAEGLSRAQEIIGMGLMGTGSLVAVIGGTMFLVVVLVSVHRARRARG